MQRGLAILYVFIPPVFSFTIDSPQTAVRFGVTVSAGVGTSLLVASMRRATQRALLAAWPAAEALRRARLEMAQRKSAEVALDASNRTLQKLLHANDITLRNGHRGAEAGGS